MTAAEMIPLSVPEVSGNEWKYIKECLDTGWVSSAGSYVGLFEEKFKDYAESKSAVVVMNGTTALALALQTLGIGRGDEVIVPSMTFIASVNPVGYVGAQPVFADITPDTWVMDVKKVEGLITRKTRAIIPVHTYGNVADMEPLNEIAERHGLFVIEDATEALGSEYRTGDGVWHKAGTMGHFGAFSFNGNKLITTGAGGMLVTNDEALGKKARHLSTQAKLSLENGGFYHEETGYNYRMPNILAAMGVAQLERVDEFIDKKLKNAALYNNLLEGVEGIRLPFVKENVKHSQWLYSILADDEYCTGRDELISRLKQYGIMSRPFFSPVHRMKPYRNAKAGDMSVTDEISGKGINLPGSVGLKEEDIRCICDCIRGV